MLSYSLLAIQQLYEVMLHELLAEKKVICII